MFPRRLIDGYRSFLSGRFNSEQSRYEQLADSGQNPEILVISCVDSRVSPEVIFDALPGELLVVRNVANLVPAYEEDRHSQHGTSAALEFGVQALKVKDIVVLGHASCGGIKAFADESKPLSAGDFIGNWMSQITPAAEKLGLKKNYTTTEYLRRLELSSVSLSLENLMTFPFIAKAVENGTLTLHGAFFGIGSGALLTRNPTTGEFEPACAKVLHLPRFRCD